MIRRILATVIHLFTATITVAQDCDCQYNFDFVRKKVAANYVGYADKVTPGNRDRFEKITDSLISAAATADVSDCYFIIRGWLDFFRDAHVTLSFNTDTRHHQAIREIFRKQEKTRKTNLQIQDYLAHLTSPDLVEGYWEEPETRNRVAIIREEPGSNNFVAIVEKNDSLFWMPGQIKFRMEKTAPGTYKIAYRTKYHSTILFEVRTDGQILDLGYCGRWYKTGQGDRLSAAIKTKPRADFRIIDHKNALLRITGSSFKDKRTVDSLLEANNTVLGNTENLIIDLRNNPGGSVLAFESLLPLLYTGPIIRTGASVLASDDNIRFYGNTDYPGVTDSMKNVFTRESDLLRQHEGEIFPLWADDTLLFPQVTSFPKKVSILINSSTASAAELFVLEAQQSAKVVVYGQNSRGAVDYSNSAIMEIPCRLFTLRYSTSRSNRLPARPVDNIGIKPDKLLGGDAADWINQVKIK